jgi:hypothetical protein
VETRSEHEHEGKATRMATKMTKVWTIASIGVPIGVVIFLLEAAVSMTLRYGELKGNDATMAAALATVATKLSEVDARAILAQQEALRLQGSYTNLLQRVDQIDNRGSAALSQVSNEVIRLKESYSSELKHLAETCQRIEAAMKEQNAILMEHVRGKGASMAQKDENPVVGRD